MLQWLEHCIECYTDQVPPADSRRKRRRQSGAVLAVDTSDAQVALCVLARANEASGSNGFADLQLRLFKAMNRPPCAIRSELASFGSHQYLTARLTSLAEMFALSSEQLSVPSTDLSSVSRPM